MNFHQLLQHRADLLRQARLANLAFAWQRLDALVARLARARLRGEVALRLPDPAAERPWPVLVALDANQSVIDEHFLDEDVVELADILAFLGEQAPAGEISFRLEDLGSRFLPGLRRELEAAGLQIEQTAPSTEDSNREAA